MDLCKYPCGFKWLKPNSWQKLNSSIWIKLLLYSSELQLSTEGKQQERKISSAPHTFLDSYLGECQDHIPTAYLAETTWGGSEEEISKCLVPDCSALQRAIEERHLAANSVFSYQVCQIPITPQAWSLFTYFIPFQNVFFYFWESHTVEMLFSNPVDLNGISDPHTWPQSC